MKKTLSFLLTVGLLLSLCGGFAGGMPVSADAISDLRDQIKDLQEEADYYRDKIESSKDSLDNEKERMEYYDKQIDAVQAQIDLLNDAIDDLNDKIYAKNTEIAEKEAALNDTDTARTEKYAQLQKRIRALAKTGNNTALQMLFDSGSYAEYLLKSKAMSCIAEYDQKLMNEMETELSDIRTRKEQLEAEKAALEEEKKTTAALKKESDELKDKLSGLYEERKSTVNKLQQNLKDYQEELEKLERGEQEINDRLESLLNQSSTVDGNITLPFFWPVPKITYISSPFGPRNPIPGLNTSSFHRGYDLWSRDAYGQSIYAAESGKVITSEKHWSYGNYVVVDHGYDSKGRRVVTLYAHMSKRLVKVGDKVTRGKTVLGEVGSTGQSEAPHLHIEVRLDNTAVDSIKLGYLVKP